MVATGLDVINIYYQILVALIGDQDEINLQKGYNLYDA
jgi:hypothetical protein